MYGYAADLEPERLLCDGSKFSFGPAGSQVSPSCYPPCNRTERAQDSTGQHERPSERLLAWTGAHTTAPDPTGQHGRRNS